MSRKTSPISDAIGGSNAIHVAGATVPETVSRHQTAKAPVELWQVHGIASCDLGIMDVGPLSDGCPRVIIATVYAAIWDITLDWGLGRKELLNCGCPPRARSGSQSTVSTASVNIDLSAPFLEEKARDRTNSAVPQATAAASIKEAERYFSSSTYRFCSICDVLGRLTWVLSLMPVTIVSKTTANRAVLMFLVSTTEILRRCMWAVLRLEYEHVANASGFRALLWLPSKLNAGGEKRSTVAQSDLASAWGNKANYLQPIIQPSLRSEGEAQVGA